MRNWRTPAPSVPLYHPLRAMTWIFLVPDGPDVARRRQRLAPGQFVEAWDTFDAARLNELLSTTG